VPEVYVSNQILGDLNSYHQDKLKLPWNFYDSRFIKHVSMYWNTSFDLLTIAASWERGKCLQIILGIIRPMSAQGINIMKAKNGWANLCIINYVNTGKENCIKVFQLLHLRYWFKWSYQFIVWEVNSNLSKENTTGTIIANIIPTAWSRNPANPINFKMLFQPSNI
jgi:hypothetical protein